MRRSPDVPLTFLLLDPCGARSSVAAAARSAGHHVLVVTGVETALAVLGTIQPDAIILCGPDPTAARGAVVRLQAAAPEIPVRFARSPQDDLSQTSTAPLN